MLKVIQEMADIGVTNLFVVSIPEMGQDLSLKDVVFFAAALSTEYLESPELILAAFSAS